MKNLLYNPSFELWTYPNSAPDGWTLLKQGDSTVKRNASVVKNGSYSAEVTTDPSTGTYSFLLLVTNGNSTIENYYDKNVTLGGWVWCDVASKACLAIYDGTGTTIGTRHSGASEWEWLTVTRTITASATQIRWHTVLYPTSGTANTARYDGLVALEGCWVPQTPYDFEDVEFRLGPTSATSIVLYPGEAMELGKFLMHNTQRAADGHLYGYEFGTYHKSSFPVQYMPASDAAIVNSWWESQAKLLLFVTSGPVTAVHSCMIMGEHNPMNQINKPYDDRFKGTIPLEGY